MTVGELAKALSLEVIALPDPDREITGGYIGDLLSWVMGRAQADQCWITIMTNINIVAVASLVDTACVLLSEGVTVDPAVKETAEVKGINLLSTPLPSYEAALRLAELL